MADLDTKDTLGSLKHKVLPSLIAVTMAFACLGTPLSSPMEAYAAMKAIRMTVPLSTNAHDATATKSLNERLKALLMLEGDDEASNDDTGDGNTENPDDETSSEDPGNGSGDGDQGSGTGTDNPESGDPDDGDTGSGDGDTDPDPDDPSADDPSTDDPSDDDPNAEQPTSGTIGTCEWSIADGILTIKPDGNAVEGTIEANPGDGDSGQAPTIPWTELKGDVTTMTIEGTVKLSTSAYGMFANYPNMASITGLSNIDSSEVTNMESMFAGCSSLSSLDLSGLKTANCTSFQSMFDGCSKLASLSLSSFDTLNVENMGLMFNGCSSLKSLSLSNFDVSNTIFFTGMFSGCTALETLDVSSFVTQQTTYYNSMFSGCESLKSLDLSGFNTAWVRTLNSCVSMFDESEYDNTSDMFKACNMLQQVTLGAGFTAQSALPTPNPEYIPPADGYWYNAEGKAFLPAEIPTGVADTYYAYPIDPDEPDPDDPDDPGADDPDDPNVPISGQDPSSPTPDSPDTPNSDNVGNSPSGSNGKGLSKSGDAVPMLLMLYATLLALVVTLVLSRNSIESIKNLDARLRR